MIKHIQSHLSKNLSVSRDSLTRLHQQKGPQALLGQDRTKSTSPPTTPAMPLLAFPPVLGLASRLRHSICQSDLTGKGLALLVHKFLTCCAKVHVKPAMELLSSIPGHHLAKIMTHLFIDSHSELFWLQACLASAKLPSCWK